MILDDAQFVHVITAILSLFASDRRLLETRGSLIVRRLCVLLNAKSVYTIMAQIISSYDISNKNKDSFTLEFVATMIQTLNLILLTASELHNLRQLLESSFTGENNDQDEHSYVERPLSAGSTGSTESITQVANEGAQVFAALFRCWCNKPAPAWAKARRPSRWSIARACPMRTSRLKSRPAARCPSSIGFVGVFTPKDRVFVVRIASA